MVTVVADNAPDKIIILFLPASSVKVVEDEFVVKAKVVFPVTVTVTHHIEEIPAGTTHALLLKDGKILSNGPIDQVVTSQNISALFGIQINVSAINGRFFARA